MRHADGQKNGAGVLRCQRCCPRREAYPRATALLAGILFVALARRYTIAKRKGAGWSLAVWAAGNAGSPQSHWLTGW